MLTLQETIAEAERCVTCGLCLPHCPTYHKTGSEADSPRGRIQLIQAVSKNILPSNSRYQAHIDLCLSCRNCETACPNGVSYGRLIDAARTHIKRPQSVMHKLLGGVVTRPIIMRLGSNVLRILQKSHLLQRLTKWHPKLDRLQRLLPTIQPTQSWKACYKTPSSKQGEVSLFLGCMTNALDAMTLQASIFVLNSLGYDVHIPPRQNCCGGIARQQGDAMTAERLLKVNQSAFRTDIPVVTVASGCGAGLKDYTSLNVIDISAFVEQCDWQSLTLAPMHKHIAVHDPCSLRNGQKSHMAVHGLLKRIPLANVQGLPGNAQCCGGAGAYMLEQTTMADQLLEDKMLQMKTMHCDILASSNIGCAMHLAAGLSVQDKRPEVLHPIVIIAKQLGFNP